MVGRGDFFATFNPNLTNKQACGGFPGYEAGQSVVADYLGEAVCDVFHLEAVFLSRLFRRTDGRGERDVCFFRVGRTGKF